MELVFATHNKNKIKEVIPLLPTGIKVLSLDDIGCKEDIAETAATLEGNALLKATYIKKNYGYDCFADDTGLEVEVLQGAPGVYSARYAGEQKNTEANIEKLLYEMKEHLNRNARFRTVIALSMGEHEKVFEGVVEGSIHNEKKGDKGFGYDPVFVPREYRNTFAELPLEEKNKISHRARALQKLIEYLHTL
ncbi:non-canonical purine NTP diphosphatase [Ascidiimonas aurantiaca]|uniref:non-canonical purine NTP diphosphatase n=1 Tax=Ascidiimonas aurantiaca TaxID=1685432 RepID=UPI0030EE8E61